MKCCCEFYSLLEDLPCRSSTFTVCHLPPPCRFEDLPCRSSTFIVCRLPPPCRFEDLPCHSSTFTVCRLPPPGVSPGIFRQGANIRFLGYYNCQKLSEKSLFTFRWGLASSDGGYSPYPSPGRCRTFQLIF